jgi:hypothetical protein
MLFYIKKISWKQNDEETLEKIAIRKPGGNSFLFAERKGES